MLSAGAEVIGFARYIAGETLFQNEGMRQIGQWITEDNMDNCGFDKEVNVFWVGNKKVKRCMFKIKIVR